jgi:hypothetical protein
MHQLGEPKVELMEKVGQSTYTSTISTKGAVIVFLWTLETPQLERVLPPLGLLQDGITLTQSNELAFKFSASKTPKIIYLHLLIKPRG